MMNNILCMQHISKTFPGVQALDDVDFCVKKGEVRCLIGANGAGKSTLMKILSGAYHKDSGTIIFDGEELKSADIKTTISKGISVIYQELSLVDSLTVSENIFLNNYGKLKNKCFINWKGLQNQARMLLNEFNIDLSPETLVSDLSIGHRQLVEILKAVAQKSKLIVMDEPSATLSKDEFDALLRIIDKLKSKGITIIYISHRLEELFIVGDSITVLRDGKHVFTGQIADVTEKELVKLMIGHEIAPFEKNTSSQNGEIIIALSSISTKFIRDISLRVNKSEIHGIYGLVGSGRTEILRAIYGLDTIKTGEMIYLGKTEQPKNPGEAIRKGIGLIPENRKTQGLVLDLPVWENSVMAGIKKFLNFGLINYSKIFKTTNDYIKKLSIKTPYVTTPVSYLSGGNQQKIVISKWLVKECQLLLVDEPTQGIDVGAKLEIYTILENLAKHGKSVIIVSSELDELLSVASRISVMYEGSLVKTFETNEIDARRIQKCAIVGRNE